MNALIFHRLTFPLDSSEYLWNELIWWKGIVAFYGWTGKEIARQIDITCDYIMQFHMNG